MKEHVSWEITFIAGDFICFVVCLFLALMPHNRTEQFTFFALAVALAVLVVLQGIRLKQTLTNPPKN